jgi:hypothetical protein
MWNWHTSYRLVHRLDGECCLINRKPDGVKSFQVLGFLLLTCPILWIEGRSQEGNKLNNFEQVICDFCMKWLLIRWYLWR